MNSYEINDDTIAIISLDYQLTKVVEKDNEFTINNSAYKIMDSSCKFYGSSYKGRLTASKEILNCAYKLPILVEESQNIVFFPTKSSLEYDCCWLNFNYIKEIYKKNCGSTVYFNNGKSIDLDVSKLSLLNQISRSTRLSFIINERKVKIAR